MQRYEQKTSDGLGKCDNGEWIKHSDYITLHKEYEDELVKSNTIINNLEQIVLFLTVFSSALLGAIFLLILFLNS